ncbi:MAG: AAA family ATPase [Candidatus Aenigmarchaeota archaeon]|nr:AAA family ATPase [Candidatus Aenigmarchaeota archaeon]
MQINIILLENIRSYEREEVVLHPGSTLLSGDIGSGKSTILLAIDFALFGFRKGELVGTDLLRHGKDRGSVALEFDLNGKNIRIERYLKRVNDGVRNEKCTLIIDGVRFDLMPSELTARLAEMLGYAPDVVKKNKPIFRYSVYTPQEAMKHILLHEEDRLETMRSIFDIDKYGIIRSNAKLFLTELRSMKRVYEALAKDALQKEQERSVIKEQEKIVHQDLDRGAAQVHQLTQQMEHVHEEEVRIQQALQEHAKQKMLLLAKRNEQQDKQNRLSKIEKNIQSFDSKLRTLLHEIAGVDDRSIADIKKHIAEHEQTHQQLIAQRSILGSDVVRLERILEKGRCEICGQIVYEPETMQQSFREKQNQKQDLEKQIPILEQQLNELRRTISMQEKAEFVKRSINEVMQWKTEQEAERELLVRQLELIQADIMLLGEHEQSTALEEHGRVIAHELKQLQQEKILAERMVSRAEQALNDLARRKTQIEQEIEEKKQAERSAKKVGASLTWIEQDFIPLMEHIEKQVMRTIQSEFNDFFQYWLSILLSDELSVRIDEQFAPIIEQNGYVTQYQNLSGGERTAIALAYRLALTKVINTLIDTIRTKDLLILDEPTDGFSSQQLDRVRDVLSELNLRQMILVSHEAKMDAFAQHVVRIYKENHVSRVAR